MVALGPLNNARTSTPSHRPKRRFRQHEGLLAAHGERDLALAIGARPVDGDDPAEAVLGVEDGDAGAEGVQVVGAGGGAGGAAGKGGGGRQAEAADGGEGGLRRRPASRRVGARVELGEVAGEDRALREFAEEARGDRCGAGPGTRGFGSGSGTARDGLA